MLGDFDTLSNWGRWGDDDQLGTLKLITPDVLTSRCRGGAPRRERVMRVEVPTGPGGAFELLVHVRCRDAGRRRRRHPGSTRIDGGDRRANSALRVHGGAYTHVDSLSHIFWDGAMYNGRSSDLVDASDGARWGAVTAAADGMVTRRGVILDIPPTRGVYWLERGEAVFPHDLEAAQARQGVRAQLGDALFLRTGHGRYRHETGHAWTDTADMTQAGWHAVAHAVVARAEVAYIRADTAEEQNRRATTTSSCRCTPSASWPWACGWPTFATSQPWRQRPSTCSSGNSGFLDACGSPERRGARSTRSPVSENPPRVCITR